MPQRVVVNHALVSQSDDGLSFNTQRFALQTLILWRGDFAAAIVGVLGAKLQLLHTFVVLSAQTIHCVGRKRAPGAQFSDQFNCGFVRLQTRPAFFFVRLSVMCDSKFPNQQWHREALKDKRRQDYREREGLQTITRANNERRMPAEKNPGGNRCQDTGDMYALRWQISHKGSEQRDCDLDRRIIEMPLHPAHRQANEQSKCDAANRHPNKFKRRMSE